MIFAHCEPQPPALPLKKFYGATFQDIFATLFARALVLATSPELYSPTGPALYVTIEPAESHFTLDWSQGPIPRNTKPVDTKSGLLLHTLLLFRYNFGFVIFEVSNTMPWSHFPEKRLIGSSCVRA